MQSMAAGLPSPVRGHPVLTQSPGAHLRGLSSGHTHRVIPLCVLSDPCTVHTTAD